MRLSRRPLALIAALFALAAIPAFAGIRSDVHRNFNVADGGRLILETDLGSVRVHPGASGKVDVLMTREAHTSSRSSADDTFKKFDVSMTQQGRDVVVRVRYDEPFHFFHLFFDGADVHFDVTVPARYNVELQTSGGELEVGDLTGDVHARTSGGSITVGKIAGQVEVHTSGGDVDVAHAAGVMKVDTSGGDIHVGNVTAGAEVHTSGGSIAIDHSRGELSAHTSGGNIRLEDVGGNVNASTSGGSVHARITTALRGESHLGTSGGSVTVALAPGVATALDAHSSGGGVSSDVPVTVLGKQNDDTLRGTINGGGPALILRSSGGGVHIEKI